MIDNYTRYSGGQPKKGSAHSYRKQSKSQQPKVEGGRGSAHLGRAGESNAYHNVRASDKNKGLKGHSGANININKLEKERQKASIESDHEHAWMTEEALSIDVDMPYFEEEGGVWTMGACINSNKDLKKIEIKGLNRRVVSKIIGELGDKKKLAQLDFRGISIGSSRLPQALSKLADERKASNLHAEDQLCCIQFDHCSIESGDAFRDVLDAVAKLGNLDALSFEGCHLSSNNVDDLCKFISEKKWLGRYLFLRKTNLDQVSLGKLAQAFTRGDRNNQYLNLSGSNLSGRAQELGLLLSTSSTLVAIDMNNCSLNDQDARQIKRIVSDNDRITYVGLNKNDIGEEGAVAIGQMIRSSTNLRKVEIKYNAINSRGLGYLESILGDEKITGRFELEYKGNVGNISSYESRGNENSSLRGVVQYLNGIGVNLKEKEIKEILSKDEAVNDFSRSFQRVFNQELLAVKAFNSGLLTSERQHTLCADILYQITEMFPGTGMLSLLADVGTAMYEKKIVNDNNKFGDMIPNPAEIFEAVKQVSQILGVINRDAFEADEQEKMKGNVDVKKPEKGVRAVKSKMSRAIGKAKKVVELGESRSKAENMGEAKATVLIGYCRLGFIKNNDFINTDKSNVEVYTEKFSNILLDRYSTEEVCDMIKSPDIQSKLNKKLEKIKTMTFEPRKMRFRKR